MSTAPLVDADKVLADAKAEAEDWIASFNANRYRVPDAATIRAELQKVYPDCLVYGCNTPKEANELVYQGVAKITGLTGDALAAKVAELKPNECIWGYYWMCFYECACGQLPDEPQFTKNSLRAAFDAGLGYLINLGSLKVGVGRPAMWIDDQTRLHREDGPAVIWADSDQQYWWHGVQVEQAWIMHPLEQDPHTAFTLTNMERRRAFFEIVGWERVLDALGATLVQQDDHGSLLEVAYALDDDSPKARFVRVVCPSTGRNYIFRVPPTTTTAKQGVAGSWGLPAEALDAVVQHT